MHSILFMYKSEHEITFLESPTFDAATMVVSQILLVDSRLSCCQLSLFIEDIQGVLPCFHIFGLHMCGDSWGIMTYVTWENDFRSIY